jgi:hypothetical protein
MRRLALAALVLWLAACGGTTPTAGGGGHGVVHGQVLAGPSCPVERASSPCPPRPVAGAVVSASTRDGSRHARTRTGTDGRFSLSLQPGTYRVVVTGHAPAGSTDTETVTVVRGGTTSVQLMLDSGIR